MPFIGSYKEDKMSTKVVFRPQGVCSQLITVEIEDNKVKDVVFYGGCAGNTQGVARLIQGMDVDEAISRIQGIRCGYKPTSCPDQLSIALKQAQYEAAKSR